MRKLLAIILTSFSVLVFGSLPLEVSMLEVVNNSNHLLTVQVEGVDMVDGNGNAVTNPEAMTGPGLSNTIRLVCKVNNVHLTNAKNVPETIYIPLDSFMHYSLGQVKKAHERRSRPMLVVLKGKSFEPAFAGIFRYPTYELDTLLALFELKSNQ